MRPIPEAKRRPLDTALAMDAGILPPGLVGRRPNVEPERPERSGAAMLRPLGAPEAEDGCAGPVEADR